MLFDLNRRLAVILDSVVTFATGLAVLITAFAGVVIAELPNGWQDTAARGVVMVLTILATAVTAIRKVTKVPESQQGLLPPASTPGTSHLRR